MLHSNYNFCTILNLAHFLPFLSFLHAYFEYCQEIKLGKIDLFKNVGKKEVNDDDGVVVDWTRLSNIILPFHFILF